MVSAVLSSGKRAMGAGAGNPPVLVDETANIPKAAKDIVDGCTFDNNLPCFTEKEVIAVDKIADELIYYMKQAGCYQATAHEVKKADRDRVCTERWKKDIKPAVRGAECKSAARKNWSNCGGGGQVHYL